MWPGSQGMIQYAWETFYLGNMKMLDDDSTPAIIKPGNMRRQ